jgi:hypothetical protein
MVLQTRLFIPLHSVQFENGNPLAKLPVDIQLRGRQVFSSVLKYAYELLTLDTMMKVVPEPNQLFVKFWNLLAQQIQIKQGCGLI